MTSRPPNQPLRRWLDRYCWQDWRVAQCGVCGGDVVGRSWGATGFTMHDLEPIECAVCRTRRILGLLPRSSVTYSEVKVVKLAGDVVDGAALRALAGLYDLDRADPDVMRESPPADYQPPTEERLF